MLNQLTNADLINIAEEFGTPVYVYHAEKIKSQFERLQSAFDNTDTKFFYAAKALTNINILRYIKSIGCNIDCSSINEVQLAIKAGFAPQNILYTSNSIAFSEIEAAKDFGVNINIDSISNLEKFGKKFGHTYPVGIRLRPNIMAGGNLKISTGHEGSKFGIPLEHIDKVIDLVKETGLFIHGLNIHTGSELKDVEIFAKGIEVLFEVAKQFPELKFLDLGGGFKVPYEPGEEGTDIEKLAEKVKEEFNWFEKTYNRHLQVWFEPGKFLVSEAGYLITKVNVLKESGHTIFAGVDSGLNHLIRPMFYGSYHEVQNISNTAGEKKHYTVVGNICETDTFAENRELPEIKEGDFIAFLNTGAYGFEMASNYNSRFKPAEVLWKDGRAVLIRKRDDLGDLLKNQLQVL
ncbi:MAG: diaminopimelate decarboxylase [Chitinophagaceae bacterium]|nr:diaminopimelate decarboxylase [Chitinophagaceae bacterium]